MPPFRHADAHFRMGSAHESEGSPCQDYALAEPVGAVPPFAVVSDGCSQSGRTDVGARVLALAARRRLRTGALADPAAAPAATLERFAAGVLGLVREAAVTLGLEEGDLDATLGAVQAFPGGGARAVLFGDGVIAARYPWGVETVVVDWVGSMPGYPGYALTAARRELFLNASEELAREAQRPACLVRRSALLADGTERSSAVEGWSAEEGLRGVCVDWTGDGADAPDVVAVMSDGVLQIAGVSPEAAIAEMVGVKSAREGAFVTRRMTRALAGFAKRGGRPVDDVSVAALATDWSE